MADGRWRIVLGGEAERDYTSILDWTVEIFGARQAHTYADLLETALMRLSVEPMAAPSRARDEDIGAGYRTLHVSRPGRHIVLYRVEADSILVVRILHDSMELKRHLPSQN